MPEEPRGPRLYLNATRTEIVPEGDPRAAVMMHEKDVRALGLKPTKAQVAQAEPQAETEETDEKAQAPAANKARSRGEDK